MAVTENPIIGRSRGKIGNVITYTNAGQNVIRSKPITYKDKNTYEQKSNRAKLSAMSKIYRPIKSIIRRTWKSLEVGKSAYNLFAGYHIKNGSLDTDTDSKGNPVTVAQPMMFQFTKGLSKDFDVDMSIRYTTQNYAIELYDWQNYVGGKCYAIAFASFTMAYRSKTDVPFITSTSFNLPNTYSGRLDFDLNTFDYPVVWDNNKLQFAAVYIWLELPNGTMSNAQLWQNMQKQWLNS